MLKEKKREKKAWMVGFVIIFLTLLATPVFAKAISLKGIGALPTVVLIVGIIIVLLQLVPAAILFFSFVGSLCAMIFRGARVMESATGDETETITIPRYERAGAENE